MKYSNKDLTYILYNNRSKRLVERFLNIREYNPYRLKKIEKILNEFNLEDNNRSVVVSHSSFDIKKEDLIYSRDDIALFSKLFLENMGNLSEREEKYLLERKIDKKLFKHFIGFDFIKYNGVDLNVIGVNVHPILVNILENKVKNGAIIIPLFKNNILINACIRRIGVNNIEGEKTLKYSLACPDIDVWGLDELKIGDEVWITEGIFDMYALRTLGLKSISVSSPHWTSIQLYKLLEKKPSAINIFSDNDITGLNSSKKIHNLFKNYNIISKIWISEYKDASEHVFVYKKDIGDIIMVDIEKYDIEKYSGMFLYNKYLINRIFI